MMKIWKSKRRLKQTKTHNDEDMDTQKDDYTATQGNGQHSHTVEQMT